MAEQHPAQYDLRDVIDVANTITRINEQRTRAGEFVARAFRSDDSMDLRTKGVMMASIHRTYDRFSGEVDTKVVQEPGIVDARLSLFEQTVSDPNGLVVVMHAGTGSEILSGNVTYSKAIMGAPYVGTTNNPQEKLNVADIVTGYFTAENVETRPTSKYSKSPEVYIGTEAVSAGLAQLHTRLLDATKPSGINDAAFCGAAEVYGRLKLNGNDVAQLSPELTQFFDEHRDYGTGLALQLIRFNADMAIKDTFDESTRSPYQEELMGPVLRTAYVVGLSAEQAIETVTAIERGNIDSTASEKVRVQALCCAVQQWYAKID